MRKILLVLIALITLLFTACDKTYTLQIVSEKDYKVIEDVKDTIIISFTSANDSLACLYAYSIFQKSCESKNKDYVEDYKENGITYCLQTPRDIKLYNKNSLILSLSVNENENRVEYRYNLLKRYNTKRLNNDDVSLFIDSLNKSFEFIPYSIYGHVYLDNNYLINIKLNYPLGLVLDTNNIKNNIYNIE